MERVNCPDCEDIMKCIRCTAPRFASFMNAELISNLQGVVPYTGSREVFLILFNISNRIKYCFTTNTEDRVVWHNFDFDFN